MYSKISIVTDFKFTVVDTAVIIDIYSFTSVIPILLNRKPKRLITIGGSLENAIKFKEEICHECTFVIGDPPKSDFPPSPLLFYYKSKFKGNRLENCTFIYQSSNGSQMLDGVKAKEIIICSFFNIKAVYNYLNNNKPNSIQIVCSGFKGKRAVEDEVCAEYLKSLLEGEEDTPRRYINYLMRIFKGEQEGDFLPRAILTPPIEMLGFCLRKDITNTVPIARKNGRFFEIINGTKG